MKGSPESFVILSGSPEETMIKAQEIAIKLPAECTLCFFGDMGSGKTTFIKGLANGFNISEDQVTSPTFVFLNIYTGTNTLYHFDLWRLADAHAFLSHGFDEFLYAPGIKCIEWSEKIEELLPTGIIRVEFESVDEYQRKITLKGL